MTFVEGTSQGDELFREFCGTALLGVDDAQGELIAKSPSQSLIKSAKKSDDEDDRVFFLGEGVLKTLSSTVG